MNVVGTAQPAPSLSSVIIKMEDRKRPVACDGDDIAPPSKRQVTTVNGTSKSHQDSDMPNQADLERFQKEAIWRRMQEYKREKDTVTQRLDSLLKKAAFHDEHIRIIDAWFAQVLDEVRIVTSKIPNQSSYRPFPSSLLSDNSAAFEKHLKSRSTAINDALSTLFLQTESIPEVPDLQTRIAQLLLSEKKHINELETSHREKEQLEERLEHASMRYMLAEKKLDRAKSQTVAKLEQQAMAGGKSEVGSGQGGGTEATTGKHTDLNGTVDSAEKMVELEMSRKEALAASSKRQEQYNQIMAANQKLEAKVTRLTIRTTQHTDEDYAQTDLFKHLKSQHEDVIKRINDLEATNVKLREEAEKLHAERTAYRLQLESESQAAVTEKEVLLTQSESDLARIRTGRDEMAADLQMRKQAQELERISMKATKDLMQAKEDRIKVLDSEIERWRVSTGQSTSPVVAPASDIENLSLEELRAKYSTIDRQYSMLTQELSSMGTAYSRTSKLASSKIGDLASLEEKVLRLGAEKSKADQKYFAAMKAKEARVQEVRTLRAQMSKSTDIVSQLKDAEAATRALVVKLEKNVQEVTDALDKVGKENRANVQKAAEKGIAADGLKTQVEELKKSLLARDSFNSELVTTKHKVEVENEELKTRLAETKKCFETLKVKTAGQTSGEEEMLRNLALCGVCRRHFKDTAIKTCGHVFCRDCVEERLQSRLRKCPNCNKAFGANDHMRITL
ncbi:E3 ubiquitin-protein ligase bre1 [Agyrium rufum]|nr:E3 ubiquitin-protein ligase bre1 [Agyrium rufum]